MGEFSGRRVVVTGAGSGIGLAMVEAFTAAGASVVAADRDTGRLEELARRLPEVAVVSADVSEPGGADAVLAAVPGRLDVLCNNAGINDGLAWIDDATDQLWDRVIRVNLTAAFLLAHRAIGGMLDAGGGVIINTASVGGLRGGRAGVAYTASKFGLIGLTQNIAATFGARGIRCNAICPGTVSTNIRGRMELTKRIESQLGRDRQRPPAISPDRIAGVALWLAGDAAANVNGVALPVDDGWIAF